MIHLKDKCLFQIIKIKFYKNLILMKINKINILFYNNNNNNNCYWDEIYKILNFFLIVIENLK